MARRHKSAKSVPGRPAARQQHSKSSLSLRRTPTGQWELVHPPCVGERQFDLEEVRQMLAAGEDEVARDELRYLLEECRDFVEAHKLLAEIALAEGDTKLSRAHFGFAFEIGRRAFPGTGLEGPLPYSLPGNQPFLEAAKGLAWCLKELGKPAEAQAVTQQLLACDPSDPLGVAK